MTKVYNPNDGVTGRDGGPYLDQEMAKKREERSARIEGREPNHSEPPRGVGIPEVTARSLMERRHFPGSRKDAEDSVIESHLANGNIGEVTFPESANFETTSAEDYANEVLGEKDKTELDEFGL